VNLEFAGAERCRDLEPDEACAQHNRAARRLGSLDDGPTVREGAQRVYMGLVGAGNGEPNRLRAGREQQPVVGDLIAVTEHEVARARLDRGDSRVEPQLDSGLRIKTAGPQRHPVLCRSTGKVVFRKVGAIHRRSLVVAQHHELALIPLPAEHLGRGETGGAAADDHDPIRRSARRSSGSFRNPLHLLSNEDFPILPLDGPERDRAESGRPQGLACAQAEAGVVPGASHGIADQQPLGEWTAVMRADGVDREDLVVPPGQQHTLLAHISREHAAVR
jgi:hypothetical protein